MAFQQVLFKFFFRNIFSFALVNLYTTFLASLYDSLSGYNLLYFNLLKNFRLIEIVPTTFHSSHWLVLSFALNILPDVRLSRFFIILMLKTNILNVDISKVFITDKCNVT